MTPPCPAHRLVWPVLALLLACAGVLHAAGPRADNLEESLRQESARAKSQERELLRLSRQERLLHADLAEASDRLAGLEEEIRAAEERQAAIAVEERAAQEAHADLLALKKRAGTDLGRLLDELWRLRIQQEETSRGRDIPTWDKADREFVWTSEIYRHTRVRLDAAREREEALAASLMRQRALAAEAAARLEEVNRAKDAALQGKLAYLRRLSEVRREKLDREAELSRILRAVQNLNYALERRREAARAQSLPDQKGGLPWPAAGEIVSRFNPAAAPPQRGVGLRLAEGAPVRAVSWGKVVHDETLRGFGRVIILLHGEEYYSLYAFLSESRVQTGQEVAQGQTIGVAGFYPDAHGFGLYFELRFRQKPINPEVWLTAAR